VRTRSLEIPRFAQDEEGVRRTRDEVLFVMQSDERVRLDKWLWAARFFKTRSAATEAVHGGKVEVNDEAAKPARLVRVGDVVRLRLPPYEYVLTVTGVAERRGSATVAATLYQENEASRLQRERQQESLRLAPGFAFEGGKPSKRDRRAFEKVRGKR
jgi:ribosome-associated heat shock protein Hsp15